MASPSSRRASGCTRRRRASTSTTPRSSTKCASTCCRRKRTCRWIRRCGRARLRAMKPRAPAAETRLPVDAQFSSLPYRPCEISHRYGDKVHILGDPLSLAMLARLCAKGTVQPEINRLVAELYRMLVHEVVATEFPRQSMAVPTRMIDATPRGVWRGDAIAATTPAVVVAVARAG